MEFKNRINFSSNNAEQNKMAFEQIVQKLLNRFSPGYIIAGYTSKSHRKFLISRTASVVYRDALFILQESLQGWLDLNKDNFDFTKGVEDDFYQIDINTLNSVSKVEDGLQILRSITSGFNVAGYFNNQKEIFNYAANPAMGDSISMMYSCMQETWINYLNHEKET